VRGKQTETYCEKKTATPSVNISEEFQQPLPSVQQFSSIAAQQAGNTCLPEDITQVVVTIADSQHSPAPAEMQTHPKNQ